jgi:hypothetical protein
MYSAQLRRRRVPSMMLWRKALKHRGRHTLQIRHEEARGSLSQRFKRESNEKRTGALTSARTKTERVK